MKNHDLLPPWHVGKHRNGYLKCVKSYINWHTRPPDFFFDNRVSKMWKLSKKLIISAYFFRFFFWKSYFFIFFYASTGGSDRYTIDITVKFKLWSFFWYLYQIFRVNGFISVTSGVTLMITPPNIKKFDFWRLNEYLWFIAYNFIFKWCLNSPW